MNPENLRPEGRYGMPAADQILYNRFFTIGYSFYFRQAKWALEIVDADPMTPVEREDNFRADYRVPVMFRADLEDYVRSNHDRGHLVASANQRSERIQNSETFLLSNMSPQKPGFNRKIWRVLEEEVRNLSKKSRIAETYVVCGPIFDFFIPVDMIGKGTDNEVAVPIPTHYFKSILTEDVKGKLNMWSFIMENKDHGNTPIKNFQVPTTRVEQYAGIELWDTLKGSKIEREKKSKRRLWF